MYTIIIRTLLIGVDCDPVTEWASTHVILSSDAHLVLGVEGDIFGGDKDGGFGHTKSSCFGDLALDALPLDDVLDRVRVPFRLRERLIRRWMLK